MRYPARMCLLHVFCPCVHRDKLQPQSKVSLRDLQKSSSNAAPPPNTTSSSSSGPAPAPGTTSSLAVQSGLPDTLLLSNLSLTAADPYDNISLTDVSVPLESVRPSKRDAGTLPVVIYVLFFLSQSLYHTFSVLSSLLCKSVPGSLLPVTVFDKHSLRVLFTFARDCPPLRPDVLVVIISMLSSAPSPVTNIRFQAAVPKVGFCLY